MTELIASLVGAIVGSVITLVYANWHEKSAQEKERRILQKTLQEECQLQMSLLEKLGGQYAQPQNVNPARVSIDIFVHALNRHVGIFGDVKLIRKLSQVVVLAQALNAALDRYEPALLKAVSDSRWLPNVESSRQGICANILLCKKVLVELSTIVQAGEGKCDRGTDPIGGVEVVE